MINLKSPLERRLNKISIHFLYSTNTPLSLSLCGIRSNMAYYAALVSVVQSLEKINSGDQCSEFFLDKQQIASIYEKLSRLQALLENYSPEDEATADCLERRIRDAAYQVQDTLDDCLLISELKRQRPRQLQDMENVKEEVDSIVEELMRMKIKKSHTTEDLRSITYYPAPKQESTGCGDTTVGFEERLTATKLQLYGESSKLQIVPLVGMGGIGKTTLARSSFYDELIVQRFDCRAWVTVSQDYHVHKVFVDILVSLKVDIETLSGVDEGLLAEYKNKSLKSEVDERLLAEYIYEHLKSGLDGGLLAEYKNESLKSVVDEGLLAGYIYEHLKSGLDEGLLAEYKNKGLKSVVDEGLLAKNIYKHLKSGVDEGLAEYIYEYLKSGVDEGLKSGVDEGLLEEYLYKHLKSGVDEGLLAEYVYKHLKGRRYLIIMDDVWDTKIWDDMKRVFPDDNNGSRIMLTTRLFDVAVYANKRGSIYQVPFLNEDQSWNLLRDKVFAQEDCPRELEVIGRFIAQCCRGLPLAIIVVAGLLSKVSMAQDDWEEVARNVSSTASENDESLSKILSLSYNQLPHHLKPCFLYMAGFPEYYRISVSRLIKLWVAEGFLKQDEVKSLEEIGEEYFEDLVKRNLVLVTEKKSNGKFKYCSVHDILRDLCVKRACKESFFHVADNDGDYLYREGTRNIIRRLYIHSACLQIMGVEELGSHIGSLLCFFNSSQLLSFAQGSKLFRVLDALEIEFRSFPVEVLELSRLRYLCLGVYDNSFFLPWRVDLENLQTIVLPWFDEGYASFEIWKMPNLRHVIIPGLRLPTPISFAHVLQNLQTLSTVENFSFSNRAIEMIPNLKKLKVIYRTYEPTKIWEMFCIYNLVGLCQLETLYITFHFDFGSYQLETLHFTFDFSSFPENFAFPQKLKKLHLSGCQLPWREMTVVGSLPHLEVLKLDYRAFVGGEWEPVEGEFLRLKFLLMKKLYLEYWRVENTHFPRLELLKIHFCSELQEIPPGIGDIPTLEMIEVVDSKRAAYSALQIHEEQQDLGNDILQVRVSLRGRNARRYFTLENKDELKAMLDDEQKAMSGDELKASGYELEATRGYELEATWG